MTGSYKSSLKTKQVGMNIPSARQGQSAGIPQVDYTTVQICYGGLCRGAGSQSLEFEARVDTARSCRETSHLSLQLPTNCNHITPPGGTEKWCKEGTNTL